MAPLFSSNSPIVILSGLKVSSIEIVEVESTLPVPSDIKARFNYKLKEFLYRDGLFQEGPDMRIEYRFIQIKKPGLWDSESWGPAWERGQSLSVETKYLDSHGEELSVISVECKGSKLKDAAERAASLVAKFTKQNFGK